MINIARIEELLWCLYDFFIGFNNLNDFGVDLRCRSHSPYEVKMIEALEGKVSSKIGDLWYQ